MAKRLSSFALDRVSVSVEYRDVRDDMVKLGDVQSSSVQARSVKRPYQNIALIWSVYRPLHRHYTNKTIKFHFISFAFTTKVGGMQHYILRNRVLDQLLTSQ